MPVTVELSTSLRRFVEGYRPETPPCLPAGLTVDQAIAALGVPPGEVELAMVNRRAADRSRVLAEGDVLGLFPPLGGG